ncbi:MAG: acyl-CoA thioesterase [Bacteroidales bacterium]|nr:acyl-CoA thioesterase [Bacteroidales bacterium]
MFVSETQIRVRYAETDKMGFVYYGNYPQYYEVGRVEAMRKLGMSYREMEEMGVMMPIANMSIKYIQPAYYDDLITVRTIVKDMPVSRMNFSYEILNPEGKIINTGETTLAFINMKSRRPCAAPDFFVERLKQYFQS